MTARPFWANPELPLPDPALSVFINCPYDDEYKPLRYALVFATVCCGFQPRMADESEDVDVPRMERIFHGIVTSNYSIHDLWRCKGEGDELLARFNMPLELGMAISRRLVSNAFSDRVPRAPKGKKGAKANDLGGSLGQRHRWLVLVPAGVTLPKYVSDLAGHDLPSTDGEVKSIIQPVMSWLLARNNAVPGMSPGLVMKAFPEFVRRIAEWENDWGKVSWPAMLNIARGCVPKL